MLRVVEKVVFAQLRYNVLSKKSLEDFSKVIGKCHWSVIFCLTLTATFVDGGDYC